MANIVVRKSTKRDMLPRGVNFVAQLEGWAENHWLSGKTTDEAIGALVAYIIKLRIELIGWIITEKEIDE